MLAGAPTLLADKDIRSARGLFITGVLEGVDMHLVMHTAPGTHLAIEIRKGGQAMQLEDDSISRSGLRPWGTGGRRDCDKGQQ